MDNSRDILNFLINYLPASTRPLGLPTHLPRLPPEESEARKFSGYKDRTLAVIGHSFGGCTSLQVAINYPALFSSLILVDPVVVQPGLYGRSETLKNLVKGAMQRREHWPTREEALRLFKQVPFFAAWDSETLKIYVEHGLAPDPKGGFRLKMSGLQEAIVFVEARVPCEIWELLESLDDRIELRWIMPGDQGAISKPISDDKANRVKVWRRPTNSSNIRIPTGHMIPLEAPRAFAQDLRNFLEWKYGTRATKL